MSFESDVNAYPVTFTFEPPERVARWRPLLHWLLVIPHLIVLYVVGLVAAVLSIIAWFAGVITAKIPEGIQGMLAMYLRYSARAMVYTIFLRAEYPPFSFTPSLADPGDDPRIRVDVEPAIEGRSRLTIFFRYFLLIPHAIALFFVGIGFYFAMIVAFFAVLILGRWPDGLRNFVVGVIRWNTRFSAYSFLLTDKYPPFSLN